MQITRIAQEIQNEAITPNQLSKYHLQLAGEFALKSDELKDLLLQKAKEWRAIRSLEGMNSDKSAERYWDSTQAGQKEIELRLEMKSCEKLMSSIKQALRLKETEYFNP